MITILDIAKMANVSRSTVSRVINNSGYVSEEVRDRVLKVIKETGYAPSQQAKALRTKETKVIGVILPRISTETSSKIVMGLDDVLSKEGYQVLLTNTNLQVEKEIEFLKLLVNRQVDGIVLIATNVLPELLKEIKNLPVPFVAIGQSVPGASSVYFDDYHAAKFLTECVIKKGKRNIAYIGVPDTDQAVGVLRKKGYLDALKENNIEIHADWIEIGDFHPESSYECMKKIIEKTGPVPEAVFVATDRMAVGALTLLKDKNIQVPDEMSIVSIGASDLSKYVTPKLTTIEYEHKKAGQVAADLLLQKIKGEEKEIKKMILSYRLREGNSL